MKETKEIDVTQEVHTCANTDVSTKYNIVFYFLHSVVLCRISIYIYIYMYIYIYIYIKYIHIYI